MHKTNTPQMANNTNLQAGTITDEINTLPLYKTGTGTIETLSNGTGIGTGTKFLTELPTGAWLFNGTDEVIRVLRPDSDTIVRFEKAFTSQLTAGSTILYCDAKESKMKLVTVAIPLGQTDGTIDGSPLINGRSEEYDKTGNPKSGREDFVNPVIIDATDTSADWRIMY